MGSLFSLGQLDLEVLHCFVNFVTHIGLCICTLLFIICYISYLLLDLTELPLP